MQSISIEREIQQENTILFGLSAKKLVVVFVNLVIFVPLTIAIGIDYCYIPLFLAAAISYFVAWFKRDGLSGPQYVSKKISAIYYKNRIRKYHTKNKYITALNKAYMQHKRIDMSNKDLQKAEKKKNKKKTKKQVSNIKEIY